MRYRVYILILFTVLTLLPWSEGAPAPARPPEVYALIYAGTGKNTPQKDATRFQHTLKELRKLAGPSVRVEPIEGTAVLRLWTYEGTPAERADKINAVLKEYDDRLETLRIKYKALRKRWQGMAEAATKAQKAERIATLQQLLREVQEAEEQLPRLLEWAKAN